MFDLDAALTEPLVVKAGGVEYIANRPTATEEVQWSLLVFRASRGQADEDDVATMTELVKRWVPALDAEGLDGRTLIRLGTWLVSGGDSGPVGQGNASGAASESNTPPPSAPTTTD